MAPRRRLAVHACFEQIENGAETSGVSFLRQYLSVTVFSGKLFENTVSVRLMDIGKLLERSVNFGNARKGLDAFRNTPSATVYANGKHPMFSVSNQIFLSIPIFI